MTPPETSHGLALGQRRAWSRGGQPLCPPPRPCRLCCSTHRSPAAKQIAVTPTAAFNQLLQLVNFTQRPKEQITGRQECRLLQLVQRASGSQASWPGETRSAVGTCHIPGAAGGLAMPRCCRRCAEGPQQLLSRQNLRLHRQTGGSGAGEAFAWRTGCHCRLCIPVCEGETRAHPDSWIQKGKRT